MDKCDHIHLIGIGGAGLSAIARVLHESGYAVSGSDRQLTPLALELRTAGVRISEGHDPGNVNGATIVVRSSAVPDDNPEVLRAREKGLPVYKRSDFVQELMAGKTSVAVAGTHGKTTTTAMAAWVLSELGQDPSFIVGGVVRNLGTNARAGKGPHFLIEADEYDRMFLGLTPDVAVVTNVEHDHPDCFPTEADFLAAFWAFTERITPDGQLWVCGDDPQARRLHERATESGRRSKTYGLEPANELRAANLAPVPGAGYAYEVWFGGIRLSAVRLQVPGRHNVQNALAVIGICQSLDLDAEEVAGALSTFVGAGRRFEVRGEAGGVLVVDDYAHHPSEIRATLEAARQAHPGRPLWVVWQPHTYSRLSALVADFSAAFAGADEVIVTDVYAAREKPPHGFSLSPLLEKISQTTRSRHVSGLEAAANTLADEVPHGAVLLVLSAGDADRISSLVLESLETKETPA